MKIKKTLSLFFVTVTLVINVPVKAENYVPIDAVKIQNQMQQSQHHIQPTRAVFPFEQSKIINQFGFLQSGFQPYTTFEVHGDVFAVIDGNLNVDDKSIILQAGNIKIIYENIKSSLSESFVKAGEKIGYADGTVNLYMYYRDIPSDFLFYFFPDKSKLIVNGEIEEKKKEKFIESQKEKQNQNNKQFNYANNSVVSQLPQELPKTEYDKIFDKAGKETNIDPLFLKTVAYVESGLNPNARSAKGAIGIMQIMPETAQALNITDVYNPDQNIEAGARYLRMVADMFNNDMKLTLAAYNAGVQAVKQYNGIPPYEETQKYVQTVIKMYENLKK